MSKDKIKDSGNSKPLGYKEGTAGWWCPKWKEKELMEQAEPETNATENTHTKEPELKCLGKADNTDLS